MVKVQDFSLEMIMQICDALNKGHECHIKKERNNIVVVEEFRKVRSKSPIRE